MSTTQTPIGSGFGAATTVSEVIHGCDLSGKVAIVICRSPLAVEQTTHGRHHQLNRSIQMSIYVKHKGKAR